MSNNLKAVQLRNDILEMERVMQDFIWEIPDDTTRKRIIYAINHTCIHKVIDKSEIEDIKKGQFVYAIQANLIKDGTEDWQEIIVKFN